MISSLEEMTYRWTSEVNSNLEEGSKIEFSVSLSSSLNARAEKKSHGYSITMNSGIFEKSFQIVGENIDYYKQKHGAELDKEFYVSIGCAIIWTSIFGHELGHILRGHLDYLESHSSNTIDESSEPPALTVNYFDEFSYERTKLLMEFDADVFCTKLIAEHISFLEKKSLTDSICTKGVIIDIAISSLYFLFNEQCRLEGESTKYPKAILRLNCMLNFITKHLASKGTLSENEARKAVNETAFGVYSFLVDDNYYNQATSSDELAKLDFNEKRLLADHSRFNEIICKITASPNAHK